MNTGCIECGAEIGTERAELGYTYCMAAACQARHRRGPSVTAVAVNKSADSYRVGDPDALDASAAAGELGAKNTTLGLDHRGGASTIGTPGGLGGPAVPAPRRPSRASRPAGASGRPTAASRAWSPAQENIVRLYADMGLSPRQIVERAGRNTPRLGLTESLVVRILAAPPRR